MELSGSKAWCSLQASSRKMRNQFSKVVFQSSLLNNYKTDRLVVRLCHQAIFQSSSITQRNTKEWYCGISCSVSQCKYSYTSVNYVMTKSLNLGDSVDKLLKYILQFNHSYFQRAELCRVTTALTLLYKNPLTTKFFIFF